MNIKALLLPILPLALLSTDAFAQTTVKTRKTVVEERAPNNLYRSIPRTNQADANKQRNRTASFKPTQHYYMRDSVVSYRYTSEMSFSGETGNYLGPQGAVFTPESADIPSAAGLRNFAAVNRRTQPGVGMAPASTTTTTTTRRTTTSIAAPSSTIAAK
jgi:hypothetical protein